MSENGKDSTTPVETQQQPEAQSERRLIPLTNKTRDYIAGQSVVNGGKYNSEGGNYRYTEPLPESGARDYMVAHDPKMIRHKSFTAPDDGGWALKDDEHTPGATRNAYLSRITPVSNRDVEQQVKKAASLRTDKEIEDERIRNLVTPEMQSLTITAKEVADGFPNLVSMFAKKPLHTLREIALALHDAASIVTERTGEKMTEAVKHVKEVGIEQAAKEVYEQTPWKREERAEKIGELSERVKYFSHKTKELGRSLQFQQTAYDTLQNKIVENGHALRKRLNDLESTYGDQVRDITRRTVDNPDALLAAMADYIIATVDFNQDDSLIKKIKVGFRKASRALALRSIVPLQKEVDDRRADIVQANRQKERLEETKTQLADYQRLLFAAQDELYPLKKKQNRAA